jgi:ADP-ribosylglycohydrolase
MLGAIAGDVIGSPYEYLGRKDYEFPLFTHRTTFTDDTVLTVATAATLLEGREYAEVYREFGRRYPGRGYGESFQRWLRMPDMGPYNSWGNGSAMRVSPVGYAMEDEAAVLTEAEKSAAVTHDHPEGIKGAQATALAVFLARTGCGKESIREAIEDRFGYDLSRSVEEIRPGYAYDISCQGSVPESITCFLESEDFEGSIRNAISLGGDADTMACIAGGIAEAYYGGVPPEIAERVEGYLPQEFLDVVEVFRGRFMGRTGD